MSSEQKRVELSFFGEIPVADGALAVMDGGTHGVQGHTVVLAPDGSASWERRLEGLRPSGEPGSGTFRPAPGELASLRQWSEQLWALAGAKPGRFYAPIEHGPPRWVWAIVMRRGSELRVLEGGAIARGTLVPSPEAEQLLDWLVDRVDGLSVAESSKE